MLIVFKVLKRIIGKMDLFSSMQLLRFDGDAETKTFTGGIFSLAIMIYLLATFSTMVFDTFNKLIITFTIDNVQDNEPEPIYLVTNQYEKSHFMLGVEVWHFDLNNRSQSRYFDVVLQNSFMQDGVPGNDSIVYTMQPCTKDHWKTLPESDQIYDKVQMHKWLCMPLNIAPYLKGKYYSDIQATMDITIKKCSNDTDPSWPCAPQQEIDDYLTKNGPMYFTTFFMNPLINPQDKNYLQYYLEDKYYIMFGVDYGMEMYIYNAGFQINTDQSIMPFSQNHRQNGSIVTSVSTNAYGMGNSSQIYGFISFFRDPQSTKITRNYQKIIDAFAYVGGLLGSFLLILIFINFYNECSYEMRFASLYKNDKDTPTTAKNFNLWYYFLQTVYGILAMVKIKCDKWKTVKFFHKTREEMVRQLDVRYLFKKLSILQNAMMLLLTQPQLKGLMLQHEMTISQAQKMRRIYGLKSRVKKIFKEKLRSLEESNDKKDQAHFKTTTEMFPNDNSIANYANDFKDSPQKEKPYSSNNPTMKYLKKYTINDLSSQSDDSSDSSDGDQSQDTIEQRLIEDLKLLRKESQKNKMSAIIIKNLDPFVKQVYLPQKIQEQEVQNSLEFVDDVQKKQQFQEIQIFYPEMVQMQKMRIKSNSYQGEQQAKQQSQAQKKDHNFCFLQD